MKYVTFKPTKNNLLNVLNKIKKSTVPRFENSKEDNLEYEFNKDIWSDVEDLPDFKINKQKYRKRNQILVELNQIIGFPGRIIFNEEKNIITAPEPRQRIPIIYLDDEELEEDTNKLLDVAAKKIRSVEKEHTKIMNKNKSAIKQIIKLENKLKDLDKDGFVFLYLNTLNFEEKEKQPTKEEKKQLILNNISKKQWEILKKLGLGVAENILNDEQRKALEYLIKLPKKEKEEIEKLMKNDLQK